VRAGGYLGHRGTWYVAPSLLASAAQGDERSGLRARGRGVRGQTTVWVSWGCAGAVYLPKRPATWPDS